MKKLLLLLLLVPLSSIGQSSISQGIMFKGVFFSAPDGFEFNPKIENTFVNESGYQIGYGVFEIDTFNSLNYSEKLKALKKFIPEIKFGDLEISYKIEHETKGVIGYTSSIDSNGVFVYTIHFFMSDKLIQIQSFDKDRKTAVSNISNFAVNNKLLKHYIKADSKKSLENKKNSSNDLFNSKLPPFEFEVIEVFPKCIEDNLDGRFTGKTKKNSSDELSYQYRCPNGHTWYH